MAASPKGCPVPLQMMTSPPRSLFAWVAVALAMAVFGAPGAVGQERLFSDDFNAFSDGQRPPYITAIGPVRDDIWTVSGGQLDAGDVNEYTFGSSWAVFAVPGSSTWRDYIAQVRFTMLDSDGAVQLGARWVDARNFYAATLRVTPSGNSIEINKTSGGIESTLAFLASPEDVQLPPIASGQHTFAIEVVGDRLTVYLDGSEVASATDPEHAAGTFALGEQVNHVLFDDVSVRRVDASAPRELLGGGAEYRVVFQDQVRPNELSRVMAELGGLPDVTQRELPNGNFTVFIGRFATQAEAQAYMDRLANEEGFLLDRVDRVTADGSVDAGTYRVVVMEGLNERVAEGIANQLVGEGVFPAEIVNTGGGSYAVVAGPEFVDRDAAEMVAQRLRRDGFTRATSRGSSSLSNVRAAPRLTRDQLAAIASAHGLSGPQQSTLERFYDQVGAGRSTPVSAQAYLDFKDRLATEATIVKEAIRALNSPGAMAGTTARQATPATPGTSRYDRLVSSAESARDAEEQGNLQEALALWREVSAAGLDDALGREAASSIDRINARIRDELASAVGQGAVPGEQDGMGGTLIALVVAVVVIAVVAVAAVVLFINKSRKQDEKLLREMKGLAPKPAAGPGTSALAMATANPPPKPAGKQPAGSPGKAAGESKPDGYREVPETSRIRPGTISRGEPPKQTKEQPKPPAPAPESKPGPAPEAAETKPQGPEDTDVGLRLDEIIGGGEEAAAADTPAAGDAAEVGDVGEGDSLKLDFLMGDSDGKEGAGAAAPAGGQATGNTTGPPPIYSEDFARHAVGKQPKGWDGEYEYATLTVADDGPGGARCLRYEKSEGIGPATYSCQFPESRGRVIVEFDICCDDKNKYLLGFYIEKDQDFRKAINTVVHKAGSSSDLALRLVNEPVPYTFGQWRKIRYEIDLLRAVLDCIVDGETVLTGHRVNNCPQSVNTLAIRDNSATEGVLKLANIRVFQD